MEDNMELTGTCRYCGGPTNSNAATICRDCAHEVYHLEVPVRRRDAGAFTEPRRGWQCPVCKQVNAPWLAQCLCKGATVKDAVKQEDEE